MKKFYLSSVKITVLSSKFSTTIHMLLLVLFVSLFSNVANAQCNGDAGVIGSNSDQLCVGSTAQFWTNGNSGTWSSSNQGVLKVENNNKNAIATGISVGTADVIYTVKKSGCPDVISKKTITVSGALGITGSISGITPQCSGTTNQVYSIPSVPNATEYVWTVPSGWIITSGQNTNSIVVTTSSNSGNLTVTVSNDCKTNDTMWGFYVNITSNKTTKPTITAGGTTSFCAGNSVVLTSSLQDNYLWSNGATTRSVTVTSSGNYSVKTTKSGYYCPSDASNSIPVTVSPNLVASVTIAASPSGAICEGTSVTFTASPTNGGTTPRYQWYKGATAISDATSATYTSTTLANNDAIKVVLTSNASSCSALSPATSGSITMTVNAIPTTPILGNSTQPDCTKAKGSIVLSGLPASGIISQTGTVVSSYAITASTMTISGLIEGTYNFSVQTGTCSSSSTEDVVINGVVTNTWNGTSWSKGTPISTHKIVFAGDYDATDKNNVDLVGCSCKITGGKKVTIKSGLTLTINNGITVEELGSLIFEDTASLIQINPVAINKGNITYKRTISSLLTSDYTYWSSPVANQNLTISQFYKSGMFFSYDDFATPENWKPETASTIMQIGKGYIIRGPQSTSTLLPPPPGLYVAAFEGVPNNGTKTIAIGSTGTSNLLGNPYPSAINADTFLATNSTLVEGTIYFWTHNTAIQLASNITSGKAGTGAYAYTSDDYASYNTTGGVGTGNFGSKSEVIANKPTGKIAAGQAFFTTSKAKNASVTFDNNMRISESNTQFFKTKASNAKTANTIEKSRIWLNLSNDQGAFKQTLVGYISDATNEYDSRFDGESFDGNEFVDFYSVNNDMNLVIQGRALPFDENDTVPLGFRSTIEGDFTINIDETDGLLTNQPVFLEDKLTNKVFDLKSGNYTFKTVAGTFDDRFVLRYTNKTLATTDLESQSNKVLVSVKNKQIQINSFSETIEKLTIYDLLGRQIYQKDKVNNNEFLITDFVSNHQTVIVKTSLQNGNTGTEKIIF